MKKVAITGGLSCGKSSVCRFFEALGAYVVSADEIVHQLLSPETSLGKKVVNLLGPNIVRNGQFDRKEIAKLVFEDLTKLGALEGLVHPEVRVEIQRRFEEEQKKGRQKLFVAEIPLLFESHGERDYDYTIAVVADEGVCQQRFQKASGNDSEEYLRRMNRQWSQEEKARLATFVIHNNGDLDQLKTAVEDLVPRLLDEPKVSSS